jgi:hypothetical protein
VLGDLDAALALLGRRLGDHDGRDDGLLARRHRSNGVTAELLRAFPDVGDALVDNRPVNDDGSLARCGRSNDVDAGMLRDLSDDALVVVRQHARARLDKRLVDLFHHGEYTCCSKWLARGCGGQNDVDTHGRADLLHEVGGPWLWRSNECRHFDTHEVYPRGPVVPQNVNISTPVVVAVK